MLKKILKIVGIVLLILVIAAFAIPYFFKDKIVAIIKTEINKNVNAKVDFADVDISLFRRFPRVAVALEELKVIGIDEFSKDTLISAKDIDVAVNLMSVIRGKDMKVYSVTIDEPRIHALVNKDGKANWDIAKPDTAAATPEGESKPFNLELNKYAIKNGYLLYRDEQGAMGSEIINLNHEGSGEMTADLFTLSTNTTADEVSFDYGGIPYLYRAKTSIDADIAVDAKNSKYNFKTEEINVNDLKLSTEGFFQMLDSSYNMDIKFNAPSTEFKTILSLIPAIYKKEFESIKTSGTAVFNGFVKGTYSEVSIPAYNVNLEVKDGFFQYPDLPKPIKNINLTLKVNNPDGVTDNTVVDIAKGHLEMDNDPFDFRILLKKPLTDIYVDAAVKGKLDLSRITQFVKLEGNTKLSGLLNADIQAKGNAATIQKQQAGEFSARGFLDITGLNYSSSDFPQPIRNTSARINVENPDGVADHTVIDIPAAHVEIGSDAVDATLSLKTPVSDPAFNGTAKGSFNLASVGQFYTFEPGTSLAGLLRANLSFNGKKSMVDKSQYDAIQLAGTVEASDVKFKSKDYPDGVGVSKTQLTFNPRTVTLNNITGNYQGTNFDANGTFDNLIGYAMKDEPLAGTLNVNADKVDLNKLMGTDTATAGSESSTGAFAVPKNIDFTLNTKVGQVKYDKVTYSNISGAVQVKNEAVILTHVKTEALDGTIAVSGSYSTASAAAKKKPDITLSYDVQNLDVQKTFVAFNTVQKLMPVAKFISGKLTSKLTMKGKLGEDMMPDFGTLTGEGTLFLLQGFLSKFGPLEKVASTLNIKELDQISVKDIKNYFEFANGKVLVKPFNVKVKDINMEIGGMHGLDQSLDYIINMKVPRALIGSAGNKLVDGLVSQANTKGIPVKLGDEISLKVNMGGTITNPIVKTDLKQAASSLADEVKQQAAIFVESKKAAADSAIAAGKQAIKDSIESAKKIAIKAAEEELKKQLIGKKDSTGAPVDTKKQLEETGKGLLKNLLKKKDTTKKN